MICRWQLARLIHRRVPILISRRPYFYSFYLVVMGRFNEAIAECRRALELDPFSLRINQHLGNSFYYARRYDEAITQYHEALELDPNSGLTHESLGDSSWIRMTQDGPERTNRRTAEVASRRARRVLRLLQASLPEDKAEDRPSNGGKTSPAAKWLLSMAGRYSGGPGNSA